jgi:hypothetical protein
MILHKSYRSVLVSSIYSGQLVDFIYPFDINLIRLPWNKLGMQSLFTDTHTTVGLDSLPGDPCRIDYVNISPGTTISCRLNIRTS